jgi:hypothetical protein
MLVTFPPTDTLQWAVVRDYRPILDLLIVAGGKPDYCAAPADALPSHCPCLVNPAHTMPTAMPAAGAGKLSPGALSCLI